MSTVRSTPRSPMKKQTNNTCLSQAKSESDIANVVAIDHVNINWNKRARRADSPQEPISLSSHDLQTLLADTKDDHQDSPIAKVLTAQTALMAKPAADISVLNKNPKHPNPTKSHVILSLSIRSIHCSFDIFLAFIATLSVGDDVNLQLKMYTYSCNSMLYCKDCPCAILSGTHSIKYLGVAVDDGLDWKEHIGAIAARSRKMIYIFKDLRQVADHRLVIQTYRVLWECLIRYCVCVWGGACKSYLITVENTQRALLKIIMFLPPCSTLLLMFMLKLTFCRLGGYLY
ncbi:hypothetical protein HF086_015704 [Spodoptera exigua]|uniref:Uncharacterized protein n=1 Tax=Spodoptera exigua TaxID=7107 RepID=A0A922MNS6_SPOEX|nr:hypothetical protein HF086_015704 [Spodoptera exigua]